MSVGDFVWQDGAITFQRTKRSSGYFYGNAIALDGYYYTEWISTENSKLFQLEDLQKFDHLTEESHISYQSKDFLNKLVKWAIQRELDISQK